MSAAPMLEERARTNDDLCTPTHITAPLIRHWGGIALDPCSNPWSVVLAEVELDGSEGKDGLTADWLKLAGGGLVFVNPPYGRGHMRRWADKITGEARMRCEIVALVNGDFSTGWWRKLRGQASAIAYFNERISFRGGAHGSGNFASAAFYFGPRPHLFAHAYQHLADVRVLR